MAPGMKRIGIFTKMDMAGGSEFRAVEMAEASSQVPGCKGVLLAERAISGKIKHAIGPDIETHEGIFSGPNLDPLYSVDHLLVINTDSRDFTTEDYWLGKSSRHPHRVDLPRIPQMAFLFNFIISPACSLPALQRHVADIRIISANTKFFEEISQQERYCGVRHYPRLELESPINPRVALPKTASTKLRLGMHSLPSAQKWNEEFPDLIKRVNDRHGDRVHWDFMGMPGQLRDKLADTNITVRQEYSMPVPEFLSGIDLFVFFLSWKREEPWARSAAEALMSGCPVITTAKGGNKHQIIHGNTGYLCRTLDEFERACMELVENPELLARMGSNAMRAARHFASDAVVRRFLDFIA
jgi:hypothetical protein